MELSHKAALEVARAVRKLLKQAEATVDVVVCPSYPSLPEVAEVFNGMEHVAVGAQHVHWEEKGAFTGAVSVTQISQHARYSIVGHSETRVMIGQTDEEVRDAVALLIRHGITPVVCLGETWEERENEQTIAKITRQMESVLSVLTRPGLSKLVVAYEPIWAISAQGRGEIPQASEVSEVILLMRKLTAERFDAEAAQKVRILYGGSVKGDNVADYVGEPGVDGVLVGSASVNPVQFVEIVKKVQAICS